MFDFADYASSNPTFYADLNDPQSLNKYQYCYNNPLLYIDPNGHQGQIVKALEQAARTPAGQKVLLRAAQAGTAVTSVLSGAAEGFWNWASKNNTSGDASQPTASRYVENYVNRKQAELDAQNQAQQQGEQQDQQGYSDDDIARMKQGRPPIGRDGKPKELHHRDQDTKKPVQPMTQTEHRGAGNSKQNHPLGNKRPSKIDRKKFKKERREYWRNEAKKEEERRQNQ